MFIYVIVCSETLKIYVGQHKGANLRQYLQQKMSEARRGISTRSYLYAAMRKHPREAWSIHPLAVGIENRPELDDLEQHYIRVLKNTTPRSWLQHLSRRGRIHRTAYRRVAKRNACSNSSILGEN